MRRDMTLPEVMLWQRLRGGRIGAKVRRQHPIGPYVVDFYIREACLIVEVDGEAHNRGNRPKRDEIRDAFLLQNGYRVLRVPATDVMANADEVVERIVALVASPLHRLAAGPPPRPGEDL
jgi:very-short-patch-repair endonuclease